MNDREILTGVKQSIKLLHEDFKQALDYDNELDLHFVFYHILCSRVPYLFNLDTFTDVDGEDFQGRRIYVEYDTEKSYRNRKSMRPGRFDIAVFGKEQRISSQDSPIAAIELKIDWKPKIKHFENDFRKLAEPGNDIRFPFFIYCDSDDFSAEYDGIFRRIKQKYGKVMIFYLAVDKMKEYPDAVTG